MEVKKIKFIWIIIGTRQKKKKKGTNVYFCHSASNKCWKIQMQTSKQMFGKYQKCLGFRVNKRTPEVWDNIHHRLFLKAISFTVNILVTDLTAFRLNSKNHSAKAE